MYTSKNQKATLLQGRGQSHWGCALIQPRFVQKRITGNLSCALSFGNCPLPRASKHELIRKVKAA